MSHDSAVLADLVSQCRPMGLADVVDRAALQTRVDRKYLVPLPVLARVVEALEPRTAVLTMEGRQCFEYVSTYYDTADHLFYADHVQGRRRRHKVRTRHYRDTDTDTTMVEVKAKSGRGETVKHRMPGAAEELHRLSPESLAFIDTVVQGRPPARELQPSLTSEYARSTLVHEPSGLRMTCDVDLRFGADGRAQTIPAGRVLVETKSAQGRSVADRLLHALGEREVSISKYCAGVALLHGRRANRWHRTLTRYTSVPGPDSRPVR